MGDLFKWVICYLMGGLSGSNIRNSSIFRYLTELFLHVQYHTVYNNVSISAYYNYYPIEFDLSYLHLLFLCTHFYNISVVVRLRSSHNLKPFFKYILTHDGVKRKFSHGSVTHIYLRPCQA